MNNNSESKNFLAYEYLKKIVRNVVLVVINSNEAGNTLFLMYTVGH